MEIIWKSLLEIISILLQLVPDNRQASTLAVDVSLMLAAVNSNTHSNTHGRTCATLFPENIFLNRLQML